MEDRGGRGRGGVGGGTWLEGPLEGYGGRVGGGRGFGLFVELGVEDCHVPDGFGLEDPRDSFSPAP